MIELDEKAWTTVDKWGTNSGHHIFRKVLKFLMEDFTDSLLFLARQERVSESEIEKLCQDLKALLFGAFDAAYDKR